MKHCRVCKETKPVSAFYLDSSKKDGRESRCKVCSKAASQAAYWRNHEFRKQISLEYARAHKAERTAYRNKRYRENPEKAIEQSVRWGQMHPARRIARLHRYRTSKTAAGGSYSAVEWAARCVEFGGLCAYCREAKKLTVHHVKPVSRGGTSFIANLVPACQSCNSSIGTKEIWPEAVRV